VAILINSLLKSFFIMTKTKSSRQILSDLKSAGYRLTQSRAAVVRVIDEANGWLRPEQVHAQAKKYCPSIGLVTVYRTLALLVEHGYIRRIHFDDKCHGYARVELSHGHHLVCRGCSQTIEVAGTEDLKPLMKQVQNETGFVIDDHLLELIGLCRECQPTPTRPRSRHG
jgi:Fe2+ or Zn2+ uptake regulation protein